MGGEFLQRGGELSEMGGELSEIGGEFGRGFLENGELEYPHILPTHVHKILAESAFFMHARAE